MREDRDAVVCGAKVSAVDGADDSRTNHQDVHRVRPPFVPGLRLASATGKRPERPDALTEPSWIVLPSSLSAVATMTARLSQRTIGDSGPADAAAPPMRHRDAFVSSDRYS